MMAAMLKDCKGAYKYLAKDNNVAQWARCFNDGTTKCEHITNNFSESFNNWILQIRDKPVCQFVEHFQNMLMTLLYERRMKCQIWDQEGIVPRAAASIEKMKQKRNEYIVRPSSFIEYQVQGVHESWTVNLQMKTCDCRIWLLTGIPCIHAVCVIHQRRLKWADYCSEYQLVKTYAAAYEKAISPLPNYRTWPEPTIDVLPPHQFRPPGRPTKNRKRGFDEAEKSGKRQRICGKCGLTGHNTRTCKGAPRNAQASSTSSTPLTSTRGGGRGRGTSSIGRGRGTSSRGTSSIGRGRGTSSRGTV